MRKLTVSTFKMAKRACRKDSNISVINVRDILKSDFTEVHLNELLNKREKPKVIRILTIFISYVSPISNKDQRGGNGFKFGKSMINFTYKETFLTMLMIRGLRP